MRPLTWALSGNKPAMASPSVDLPQPDSPTSPTFSPGPIVSEMLSTACTVLLGRAMSTLKSSTTRTGAWPAPLPAEVASPLSAVCVAPRP